jgi:hypothetical protein
VRTGEFGATFMGHDERLVDVVRIYKFLKKAVERITPNHTKLNRPGRAHG